MATMQPARTPWHLWAVGIVSLPWNAYGGYDYVMSETGNQAYFQANGMGAEEIAWVAALPTWSVACWAIGVWGSVLGSLLLLLRSRFAAPVFLVSLVGAVISFAYQFTADAPAAMHAGLAVIAPIVILVAIVAQWYYARRMAAAGVLR
ncbi:MAG TPA: hypothetical protein VEB68_14670 [Croceibacterium sp.]|nr:hypothetical protein [Croceibacterium sp.]